MTLAARDVVGPSPCRDLPKGPMRLALLHFLLLTASLSAQTVWLVPDNTSVDAVIALAAPGDTVQLATTHPPFTINKGVHVVGAPGGTSITYLQPPNLPGPGSIVVAVPAGQRAVLRGVQVEDSYFQGSASEGFLELRSGQCEVSEVGVGGPIQVRGGNHVLQRITGPGTWLNQSGGICSVADSTFHAVFRLSSPFGFGGVGVRQTGGLLLASHVSLRGTDGSGPDSAKSAMLATGGAAYLTDCTLQGGNLGFAWFPPAAPALVGNQLVHFARTTLTDGVGAPPSSGYSVEPAMVGLSCQGVPTLGGSFTAVATAGTSQQALGMIGGFEAAPATVASFVEPLFGSPGNLIPVLVAFPAPAASVSATVNVPNVLALRGVSVWLQAAQIDGAQIRASVVVGGSIR